MKLKLLAAAAATVCFGASAQAATIIQVIGTTIEVTCDLGANPDCQGFSGGGSTVFPTTVGVLGNSAQLYTGVSNGEGPSTVNSEADALDILIDGIVGNDFVEADGTRTDAGGVDTFSFFSSAAYIAFKIGAGHFFIANSSPGEISVFFDKNGETAGGLSHFTEFGTTPIPLPAAGWLLLAGVGGLAAMRRRRKAA